MIPVLRSTATESFDQKWDRNGSSEYGSESSMNGSVSASGPLSMTALSSVDDGQIHHCHMIVT